MMHKNFSLLMLIAISLCACGSLSQVKISGFKFIGDQKFASTERFDGQLFGGLSGIAYDRKAKIFWAISDNGGQQGFPRIYQLSYELKRHAIKLKPKAMFELKDQNAKSYQQLQVDYESIALWKDFIILGDEGNLEISPQRAPHIAFYNKDSLIRANDLPVPDQFLPKSPAHGVRHNRAFEAVTVIPGKATVISANEEPLLQDGLPADEQTTGSVRWVKWDQNHDLKQFVSSTQYIYNLGPIAGMKKGDAASVGLVDIIALDEDNFLTLERSWNETQKKQNIRIFKATLSTSTTNVARLASLEQEDEQPVIKPVEKVLLADMDQFLPFLKAHNRFDNIEGFCIGPKLKNGNRTLFLVSDNNFSDQQSTQFIALEILP